MRARSRFLFSFRPKTCLHFKRGTPTCLARPSNNKQGPRSFAGVKLRSCMIPFQFLNHANMKTQTREEISFLWAATLNPLATFLSGVGGGGGERSTTVCQRETLRRLFSSICNSLCKPFLLWSDSRGGSIELPGRFKRHRGLAQGRIVWKSIYTLMISKSNTLAY